MIDLDGSHGEGGGQILRTGLALALVTGKPFRLKNIRARRPKPGLQAQHLMSVQAAAQIGQARMHGASLGSSDLVFEPGTVVPGDYHFRIGTAGATGLVLHTIYLPLALAGGASTVAIEGGTHVKASPCFHFLEQTWRAYMALLGLTIELHMDRPGFYPRGGGLIRARIAGSAQLRGFTMEQEGDVHEVTGLSVSAGLPASIARRQAERARRALEQQGILADIREEIWPRGPGTMLLLLLPTAPVPSAFFALGERGKPAESVADEAVAQVLKFRQAIPRGIDPHSADQVLLPLSLATTPSRFPVSEITQHLLTNAAVVRRFVDVDIRIDGAEGEGGRVEIGQKW